MLRSFIIVFLNDAHSIELMQMACFWFVTGIRIFKMLLPSIWNRLYKSHENLLDFQGKVYLLYIYETICLVANIKQHLSSK
jgi:hypothetical protein